MNEDDERDLTRRHFSLRNNTCFESKNKFVQRNKKVYLYFRITRETHVIFLKFGLRRKKKKKESPIITRRSSKILKIGHEHAIIRQDIISSETYNGTVPVYSSQTTEFTIKQKAFGNKGDKIFLSENIYDSPYFRERERGHDRCVKDFCEESDRSLFTGRRIHCLLAFMRLKYVNLAGEGTRGEATSSLVISSTTSFLPERCIHGASFINRMNIILSWNKKSIYFTSKKFHFITFSKLKSLRTVKNFFF